MNTQKLISRAILKDKILLSLYAERVNIYTFITPRMIFKDGNATLVWIDETNSERLKKVDELIQFRIDQIVDFYKNNLNKK